MPTPNCVKESEDRLKFTKDKIERLRRVLQEARDPTEIAFGIKHLKLLEATLVALEASHAMFLELAKQESDKIENS